MCTLPYFCHRNTADVLPVSPSLTLLFAASQFAYNSNLSPPYTRVLWRCREDDIDDIHRVPSCAKLKPEPMKTLAQSLPVLVLAFAMKLCSEHQLCI